MKDTTLRRKRAAVAAAATAAVGSAAAPAIFPAPAAAFPAGCPGNTICEYFNAGFGLPVQWWNPGGSDNTYGNNGYSSNPGVLLNDSISSVWNNSNRWLMLCRVAGCENETEWGLCFGPGKAIPNLSAGSPPGGTWNDVVSAHRTYGGQPPRCSTFAGYNGCSL
jgi:hypothetical protein